MLDYAQRSELFLREEKQYQLGFLPTEQSHYKTRGLSETLQSNIGEGIRLLQSVDTDVAASASGFFNSSGYDRLVSSFGAALRTGGRICFSGCGATGRLSILLESCWRRFWKDPSIRRQLDCSVREALTERVCSLMTGGDYALIRSVESFEDYASFGRQQVREADLGRGDVLVAISEGGETSSVIGTIQEAVRRGVETFFVFNNPSAVLVSNIERSRLVIENPAVTKLDLSTGPMAVAGSTRMQATTAELLVVGLALEQALVRFLPELLTPSALADLPSGWLAQIDGAQCFQTLLDDLGQAPAIAAMTSWVEAESALYARRGRVTYFADECLLDIFTDTTERSPTFMLPPFRKHDDLQSPPPWAFVKDPVRATPEAWRHMLNRMPRCIVWGRAMYEELDGPSAVRANPPRLGLDELLKYHIGNEGDPSRYESSDNVAIALLAEHEARVPGYTDWEGEFFRLAKPFHRRMAIVFGSVEARASRFDRIVRIPCRSHNSPLGIWRRLTSKLVLNTVSTATMGRMGRLSGNWMTNVAPTNKKLIDRGIRLISELTGVTYSTACYALHQTMSELKNGVRPGMESPSPVTVTVNRLRADPGVPRGFPEC